MSESDACPMSAKGRLIRTIRSGSRPLPSTRSIMSPLVQRGSPAPPIGSRIGSRPSVHIGHLQADREGRYESLGSRPGGLSVHDRVPLAALRWLELLGSES